MPRWYTATPTDPAPPLALPVYQPAAVQSRQGIGLRFPPRTSDCTGLRPAWYPFQMNVCDWEFDPFDMDLTPRMMTAGVPVAEPPPPPVGVAPTNTVLPQITGTMTAGSTLTCSTGTWADSPDTFAFQWRRNGTPVAGATASTYLLGVPDQGTNIDCVVTATNAFGSATATAPAVSIPVPAPTYAETVLADSPLGYWRLPSGAPVAGAGTIKLPGAPPTGASLNTTGGDGSLSMDGADDSGSVPNALALQPATVAVEAWVNVNASIADFAVLLMKTTGSSWADGWGLHWQGGKLRWWVTKYNGLPGHFIEVALSTGVRHHVVGRMDGTNLRLYVDGAEVAGSPQPHGSGIVQTATALLLGTAAGGSFWKGLVDEVAVYTDLSAARIAAHYAAGTA